MWPRVDLVLTDVSHKRRFAEDLHGATSQNTALFIVTAVKISNLTHSFLRLCIIWISSNICSSPYTTLPIFCRLVKYLKRKPRLYFVHIISKVLRLEQKLLQYVEEFKDNVEPE
jgi:hypothetical protein